jgi:hypothetical protein
MAAQQLTPVVHGPASSPARIPNRIGPLRSLGLLQLRHSYEPTTGHYWVVRFSDNRPCRLVLQVTADPLTGWFTRPF